MTWNAAVLGCQTWAKSYVVKSADEGENLHPLMIKELQSRPCLMGRSLYMDNIHRRKAARK